MILVRSQTCKVSNRLHHQGRSRHPGHGFEPGACAVGAGEVGRGQTWGGEELHGPKCNNGTWYKINNRWNIRNVTLNIFQLRMKSMETNCSCVSSLRKVDKIWAVIGAGNDLARRFSRKHQVHDHEIGGFQSSSKLSEACLGSWKPTSVDSWRCNDMLLVPAS